MSANKLSHDKFMKESRKNYEKHTID